LGMRKESVRGEPADESSKHWRARMADKNTETVCVAVEPGICGFPCIINAEKMGSRMVALHISGSDCRQIKNLSERLARISLEDLFAPISRNPVYALAEEAGCHLSCPVPVAVIKAAEVAYGTALPRNVQIRFIPCKNE
jgi:hypothetical protein